MSFSSIFPKTGRREMGRYLPFKFFSFFLFTGTTFAYFHISGKIPCLKQFSNINFNGMTNALSLSLIILTDIQSQPCALLGLSDLMIFRIFSSEITKSFS